jgi:hypothetical protein
MQGLRNVLTDKRLFLPTVHIAQDFLRVAHARVMTSARQKAWPIFVRRLPSGAFYAGFAFSV